MATIDNRLIYEQYANRIITEAPDTRAPIPEPTAEPTDPYAKADPKMDVNLMAPESQIDMSGKIYTIGDDWQPGAEDINLKDEGGTPTAFKAADINSQLQNGDAIATNVVPIASDKTAAPSAPGTPASAGGTGDMDKASQDAWDNAPVRKLGHDILNKGQTGAKTLPGQKLQQAIFNVGRAAIGSPDVEVRGGSVYGQDGQGGAAFGQKAQTGNTEYDKRLNKSYTHKSRY